MQGVRVSRQSPTAITTLRLTVSMLSRARARDRGLARHVGASLGLDGPATMTDVLREAVALGLGMLEAEAAGAGKATVERQVQRKRQVQQTLRRLGELLEED